jgi:hypothetical protein
MVDYLWPAEKGSLHIRLDVKMQVLYVDPLLLCRLLDKLQLPEFRSCSPASDSGDRRTQTPTVLP